MPPGFYGIRCYVWDHVHRQELGNGPGAHFNVTRGQPFKGSVQVNAKLMLEVPTGGPSFAALDIDPSLPQVPHA